MLANFGRFNPYSVLKNDQKGINIEWLVVNNQDFTEFLLLNLVSLPNVILLTL